MDTDEDWLTELYVQHKRLLLLVAWNLVNRREIAEDIVHAAIVRMAELLTPPENSRAYAIRTVRNLAIDFLRKECLSREEDWNDIEDCHEPFDVGSAELNSMRLKEERLAEIDKAMNSIDSESREMIRLHLQAKLSFREIGELLNLPIPTVASRYRRAIEKIKLIVEIPYE
jgi:RNA polymerase sigma-70 factor, ECF subfamily